MFLLGLDLGSSAVKASLLDAATGRVVSSAQSPQGEELPISAPQPGWAEQDPAMWWKHTALAIRAALAGRDTSRIVAMGISYQMHGLVMLDTHQQPVRPAIIWCDSRAVEIGAQAFAELGVEVCLGRLLNSPGNFTASKLRWVQQNETANFARIRRIMLPGDYLALRLTGEAQTTVSGLSEGTLWDFSTNAPADFLLDHWRLDRSLLSALTPTFGKQAGVLASVAAELGLPAGIPVAYRAGDQPNNAFSLNVLNPGEIVATGGTSGVVYGVTDKLAYDSQSRVNGFAHVNHTAADPRVGVLLCINGTGILYAWLRRTLGANLSYPQLNALAAAVPAGSEGLSVLPFGNGSERMLGNRRIGSQWSGLDFLRHTPGHLARAVQEGIAFSFSHGIAGMKATGLTPKKIRAGNANLFLSPVFRDTLAATLDVSIELVRTDGSAGAARGAGIGAGIYSKPADAFTGLEVIETIHPNPALVAPCQDAAARWEAALAKALS
ncbi:xylulokinase [Rariglobus hedericola]|uniref:Carbohydrate kinase n=1 Tax=Rariglobus hedericola TaxID=2597822 RepID=A0A556QPH9_9BACT|nr:FGGY family carbohydrate kinase [Rariglobus hedericola]TSJ78553.1 carbohydrate kinase [Rariglobus hedericola]